MGFVRGSPIILRLGEENIMKRTLRIIVLLAIAGMSCASVVSAQTPPATQPAGRGGAGGFGQGRGGRGFAPVTVGPPAPVPAQVAIPRPTPAELAQINDAIKHFVETDTSSTK